MPSPVEKVTKRLSAICPKTAEAFVKGCVPKAKLHRDQVHEVNGYLRTNLGLLEHSTITERECLTDTRKLSVWLRDIERIVIPTIVAHGLVV